MGKMSMSCMAFSPTSEGDYRANFRVVLNELGRRPDRMVIYEPSALASKPGPPTSRSNCVSQYESAPKSDLFARIASKNYARDDQSHRQKQGRGGACQMKAGQWRPPVPSHGSHPMRVGSSYLSPSAHPAKFIASAVKCHDSGHGVCCAAPSYLMHRNHWVSMHKCFLILPVYQERSLSIPRRRRFLREASPPRS